MRFAGINGAKKSGFSCGLESGSERSGAGKESSNILLEGKERCHLLPDHSLVTEQKKLTAKIDFFVIVVI